MNLRTASLLCNRFLSSVGDGGLVDQLGDVLAKGGVVSDATSDGGEAPQSSIDELSTAAKKALSSYDQSLFADAAMKIFPEYAQLGFASIMAGDFEKCLSAMCDADGRDNNFSANLARIGREGEGISELTEQIERLVAVANYFGVESRDDFDADAIAVIQMPDDEGGEHVGGNVDAFVERMQSFQSIVEFCGVRDETGANIRMIAGDDALVVADLSSEGAHKLQNIISDVKSAKSDIVEVENASERLKNVGVSDKIIDMLGEEIGLIRGFDESKAGSFITSLLKGENSVTSKWMANAVMGLLDSGVRIDSVVLKPQESGETTGVAEEMAVVAEALEALDDEAVTNVAEDPKMNEASEASSNELSDQSETNQTESDQDDTSSSTVIAGATAVVGAGAFAADNVVELVGKTSEKTVNFVSDGAEAASEKISEMTDETCNLADNASEQVEEAVETASDAVSDGVEKAETIVEDTKDAISNGVSNGIDEVSNTVDEAVEKIETKSEAEINAARARKKSLRSIWETFSGRS